MSLTSVFLDPAANILNTLGSVYWYRTLPNQFRHIAISAEPVPATISASHTAADRVTRFEVSTAHSFNVGWFLTQNIEEIDKKANAQFSFSPHLFTIVSSESH